MKNKNIKLKSDQIKNKAKKGAPHFALEIQSVTQTVNLNSIKGNKND